jgi:membrane protein
MRRHIQKLSDYWDERLRFQVRMSGDILRASCRSFSRHGCLNLSAALAFYTILSLIPFLFLLVSVAAFILGSSEQAHGLVGVLLEALFPRAGSLIFQEVQAMSRRAGVLGLIGILSMIWTASIFFASLEKAMMVVFRIEQKRNFLQAKLLALAMLPAAGIIFFLSLLVTILSGTLGTIEFVIFGINFANRIVLEFLLGYIIPYLILVLALTAIYKYIPNTDVSYRHALAGGATCSFLFEVAKHFFTWYIHGADKYSIIYGSLEVIVILVLWAFYSSTILLFCAELVSEYRRRDIALLEKAFL